MSMTKRDQKSLKVLVACEYSGRVREAFAALGHDAMSCDLLPTEQPGNHYQGDVRDVLYEDWDLLIGFPDCTYMTNSGVRWLHTDASRWPKLFDAADFFKLLWSAKHIKKKCLENPIWHKYARQLVGIDYTQIIHPHQFGHMEQKATCLYLQGLDPLLLTNNVKAEMMLLPKNQRERLHYLPPSADRWKERSRTYPGIADAMAMQWGKLQQMEQSA